MFVPALLLSLQAKPALLFYERIYIPYRVEQASLENQLRDLPDRRLVRQRDGWVLLLPAGPKIGSYLHQAQRDFPAAKAMLPELKTGTILDASLEALQATRAAFDRSLSEFERLPPDLKIPRRLGQEDGMDYLDDYLEWYEARAFPNSIINWSVYPAGRRHQDGMLGFKVKGKEWEFIGPRNFKTNGIKGAGNNNVNGRVVGIAVRPGDEDTVFVASSHGGIWKTTNGGTSWNPLSFNWETEMTNCVAINPNKPNQVFVGTGDFDEGRGNGEGVYVSENNGLSWTRRGSSAFGNNKVRDIVFVPEQPSVAIAASGRNGGGNFLQRSDNDGVNWSDVGPAVAHWCDLSVSISSAAGRYIWAAGYQGDSPVLYRSSDEGLTWVPISINIQAPVSAFCVAASKVSRNKVYIYAPDQGRVDMSTNGGGSWSNISGNLLDEAGVNYGQNAFNFGLETALYEDVAGDRDAVFVANVDLLYTSDDGNWESKGKAYQGSSDIHVDHHRIANDPNDPERIWFGGDGGAYLALHVTGGINTFSIAGRSNLLGTGLVNRVSAHPTNPDWVISGAQDNGNPGSTGGLFDWEMLYGGDGGHTAIDQKNGSRQFIMPPNVLAPNGIGHLIYTKDSWATRLDSPAVNILGDKKRSNPHLVIDPSDSNRVYFATDYLYRFNVADLNWFEKMGGQMLSVEGHVRALAVAPNSPNVIYTVSNKGEVWMTENGGASWKAIHTGNPSLPVTGLEHIVVNPKNAADVLVCSASTTQQNLWRCSNTRAIQRSWVDVSGSGTYGLPSSIPINRIARHPVASNTCWVVATDLGVFITYNGGGKWADITRPKGLPRVEATDIIMQPGTNYMYASTYGRGIWRMTIPPATDPVDDFIGR